MWIYIAIGMTLWLVIFYWHLNQMRRQQEQLSRDLAIFSEASARVAQTLDQFMLTGNAPNRAQPSRRHLLASAKAQLGEGVSIQKLESDYGLSCDEQRLFSVLTGHLVTKAS